MKIIYFSFIVSLFILQSLFSIETKDLTADFILEKNDTLTKSIVLDDAENEFIGFSRFSREAKKELSFKVNIKNSKIFRIYSTSPQTIPLTIYVTPGDEITFKTVNNFLIFKGKNAKYYNFYGQLLQAGIKYPIYLPEMKLTKFKKDCFNIYNKKILFLEKYCKNNIVSDAFFSRFKKVLFFEYLNWILIPKKQIIENPTYLSDIKIDFFIHKNLQDDICYNLALMKYVSYISIVKSNKVEYSKELLMFQLNFIEKKLDGNVKEYAITKTLIDFFNNLNPALTETLIDSITKYSKMIKNETYISLLKKVSENLKTFKFKLPVEILNSTVIDTNSNVHTIDEVLNLEKNAIKVIDFWASWCAPCVSDLKETNQFRNYLINNNVTIIYMSIDENKSDWIKRISQLENYNIQKNQYLINKTKFSIADYLNVKQIPRYVILNKENEVVMVNAPSLKDSLNYKKIITDFKSK
ncbi:thioredoxin-like domain-containing protein [Flavobacterium sp. 20NA77.7]|uniref:Thioredoxin-like domain-containing protein n=1 Tax=Flavobacterium nakdongensis TaxID=3073563 RepID=A0ABY9R9F9_9FLAO|nr:thioredoxin-like domain-containing protein [Flavobacterium sp. 20NA77.7]WMW76990.1 thioredoxin-like domain-containing protein [Flavobacterium sp. 20NA77.7]